MALGHYDPVQAAVLQGHRVEVGGSGGQEKGFCAWWGGMGSS